MRITAGLASVDQYPLYVSAGADEVFCGYVPDSWTRLYGLSLPLNRREVRYCPVQIGGRNELRILAAMQRDLGIPVTLTFNAPFYRPDQLPVLTDLMEQCLADGFRSFIVADPGLMFLIKERGLLPELHLHVSGEAGEINSEVWENWRELGMERLIFPRQTALRDMKELIRKDRERYPDRPVCTEAFIMNEMCHYTGAFCAGLHCDEFPHLCHLPFRTAPLDSGDPLPTLPVAPEQTGEDRPCGLCALDALKDVGVEVLKVVGRGAFTEEMIDSIRRVRHALTLTEQGLPSRQIGSAVFPDGCSGRCYYP